MKKSVRFISVILGSILAISCGALIACGGNGGETFEPPEKPCLVRVEGGTGGGYYYVNTNCTVKAEIPEGKQFMKWVAGTTDLSPNAEYTFTVTKNIALKAVFADDVPNTEVYDIDVHWGNGSGTYFGGSKLTVTPDSKYSSLKFTGWEATYEENGEEVTKLVSTQSVYEFTVDKDMYLTATFEEIKLAAPDNSDGAMFKVSANTAYEFDRQKNADGSRKTAFVQGCEYLLYVAYEKNASDELVEVGRGKIVPLAKQEGEYHSYFYSMDEKTFTGLKGGKGDIYQDVSDAKATIRKIMNMEVGKEYFVTVQAMAADDTPYNDSDVSDAHAVTLKN